MAILRLRQSLLVLAIALLSAPIALAVEEGEPETEQASQDGREEVGSDIDGTIDDAVGSIEEAVEERGLETGGDIRVGLSYSDLEDRDGTEEDDGLGRARWRVQVSWGILDNLRFKARPSIAWTTRLAPVSLARSSNTSALGG